MLRGERIQMPLQAGHHHADIGPTLESGLVALCFSGSMETLYFCNFSGGRRPVPSSGSAHAKVKDSGSALCSCLPSSNVRYIQLYAAQTYMYNCFVAITSRNCCPIVSISR